MTRIGLFGGTFNPVHFGHLRPAEEIGESLGLEKVIFIPSSCPPHKERGGILPGSLRAEMVRLAIAGNPRFSLSEVELNRPGKSYSVETITHFRREIGPGAELYFILGLDAFREVNTWKEYPALFSLCHFVVMTRPGFEKKFEPAHLPIEIASDFCYDGLAVGYRNKSGFFVFPREITALEISSTMVRNLLCQGRSVRYLLPPEVEDFIRRNHLYQAGT